MESRDITKYFYIIAIIGAVYLAFLIVRPFIVTLLTSALIAYIFRPAYLKLNSRLKMKKISAAIISVLIIIIFSVPLFFVLNATSQEAYTAYLIYKQRFAGQNVLNIDCEEKEGLFCDNYNKFNKFITTNPRIKFYLDSTVTKTSSWLVDKIQALLISIPGLLLHMIIVIMTTYFLFVDWDIITKKLEAVIPFKKQHKSQILKKFNDMSKGLIYGQILIALFEGAVGAIGFFIFGISSPILWGIVMAILALIPVIGASLIWIPASLYLAISGAVSGSTIMIWKGVGLFIYGMLFVSSIETFLKPIVVGGKAKVHPLIVLIGIIGGMQVFGFVGLFIGPLILVLFITILEIYEKECSTEKGCGFLK